MRKVLFIFLIFSCQFFFSQTERVLDSLNLLYKNAKHDTSRLQIKVLIGESLPITRISFWDTLIREAQKVERRDIEAVILNNLGFMYNLHGDESAARKCYLRSIKINEEIGIKKQVANTLNNIGLLNMEQGKIPDAIECLEKSLRISESIDDQEGCASAYNSLGGLYNGLGDIHRALQSYEKSLKIRERAGQIRGISQVLNNIANIYESQGDLKNAKLYFERSLNLSEKIGDKLDQCAFLNNLAYIHNVEGNLLKSQEYYERSLKLAKETGDISAIALAYQNLGAIHSERGDLEAAYNCIEQSLQLLAKLDDERTLSNGLISMSFLHYQKSKKAKNNLEKRKYLKLALSAIDSGLSVSKRLGFPEIITRAEEIHYTIDLYNNDYRSAYQHYKQYILYRDSISNEGTRKASMKSQLKYEFEKKEAVLKEQQEKERMMAQEKDRFNKIVIFSVVMGLVLVVAFALWIFRTLKITKQQKLIIEEKQKEIIDSINYAERIQRSLMPTEKHISVTINRLFKVRS